MKQRLKSEMTIGKIKGSAFRLFAQRGYSGTSVDEIMKETGLTKGAFYAHFDSKEELFLQIMNEWMVAQQQKVIDMMRMDTDDVWGTMEKKLEMIMKQAEEEHWLPIFIEFLANVNRSPIVQKNLALMYEKWREVLEEEFQHLQEKKLIQTKISAKRLAQTVIALYDGFHIQSYTDPHLNPREQIEVIFYVLKKGCR